ncbi:MAG: matrixin, partial [Actinobacteria bacterium]|nr:matrixin [Actinomycetota bacterium]NIU65366.1 matrixin [Actinomycetota bacterium]NIW27164.1 matrixin [Actinomycetota bacterium]
MTVGVDGSARPNRSFVGLVEAAVAYWNGPGRANATYPVTFRVVPNATDPDVLVVVKEAVECADHEDVLGCAPRLSADSRPPRPVIVEVAAGFSDATTQRTVEHELGHVLGIRHGEPPLPLMEARFAAATLPATDAVNKSNPWTTPDLRVYVDYANATADRDTLAFQLARAVEYYDAGAEGHVPANTSFALVENRSAAQIVVRFNVDREGCSTDAPRSCGSQRGFDPDRDGALEYYTSATVVLNGLDA